jgi:prolyl-tRNA synthetase
MEETLKILDVYATFAQDYMAMPVIKGEKTAGERFPGAVNTYSIEAMMQDRKALQAGTSHFLGQNFSKAQDIKFLNQEGKETFAWTTSWGVSTRLVGALIMTHSDDDGVVLPPRLAPAHVVILPIFRSDDEQAGVLDYCRRVQQELSAKTYDGEPVRVVLDTRDLRGGEKTWQHIKKGVPLRLEIGPRDVAGDSLFVGRRDTQEKKSVPRGEFVATIDQRLAEIQTALFSRALALRESNTREIDNRDEFVRHFTPKDEEKPEIHGGFVLSPVAEVPEVDELLKSLKVTIRCLPVPGQPGSGPDGPCIFTGKSARRVVLAKAY